jgi:hypothetical protein
MLVTAFNPSTDNLEKTYIAQYTAEGVSSLTVTNTDRFTTTKAILIGRMGEERSELAQSGTVTAPQTIALNAATSFAHNGDDPVYLLKYNQVKFYSATSENGSYSLLATVDIDVDNSDGITRYEDTSGTDTTYYKVKYYNSVTTAISEYSDPVPATGYAGTTIGSVIEEVVSRVRDPEYTTLTREDYLAIARLVGDDLISQTLKPYRFLRAETVLNTVAGQNYINLATAVTDFWKFDYLTYDLTIGSYTETRRVSNPISEEHWIDKYESTNWPRSDEIRDIAVSDDGTKIYLGPTPKTSQTGKVNLHYFAKFDRIDSFGDVVQTPNTLIYRAKMMAEFYYAKAESDSQWLNLAQKYDQDYGNEMVKMQRFNRVDVGTPRSFAPKKVPGMRKRYTL